MGIRRIFRRFVPRRTHPVLDAPVTFSDAEQRRSEIYGRLVAAAGEGDVPFIAQRFYEGVRWQRVITSYLLPSDQTRVLDVGGGNGAVEIAFEAADRFILTSVERLWNPLVRGLVRSGIACRRSIGDAATLPFQSGSFDAVLCLETIEHFHDDRGACAEIARVLRPNGIILLTTPPRWRYALRADPHFGIRGLVLLPPRLQRAVAARFGHDKPDEYVGKIYSSVPQVARLFPGCTIEAVLTRQRLPQRWFWDAIVLRRTTSDIKTSGLLTWARNRCENTGL